MSNYFNDRVAEYPGRVTMTPTGQSDTYDMARAEGTVTEPGSPFNAETFNGAIDLYAMWYGTCSTIADSMAKIVSCPGFTLVTGATIAVKFDNANTYTGATYLDVNSTGSKRIRSTANSTAAVNGLWNAGEVVTFVYDGSSWIITGQDITAEELATLESALGIQAAQSPGTRLGATLDTIVDRQSPGALIRPLSSHATSTWTYTAPSTGMFYATIACSGARQYIQVSRNGSPIAGYALPAASGTIYMNAMSFFLKKGDTLQFTDLNSTTFLHSGLTAFVPMGT